MMCDMEDCIHRNSQFDCVKLCGRSYDFKKDYYIPIKKRAPRKRKQRKVRK